MYSITLLSLRRAMSHDTSGTISNVAIFVVMIFALGILVLTIIGVFQAYMDGGSHGWACIVPFYGTWEYFRIAQGAEERCF